MFASKFKFGTSLLALGFMLAGAQPGNGAALSNAQITEAIKKAEFLPAGSTVNVRSEKDQVLVSTYRHSNLEKDCKIHAVLIAKAIFELSPDQLGKVVCYFFGKDMSSYQEVAVTAGDIKAFGGGDLSEEQLLSSLSVKTVSNESASDRVARQLESNWISRPSEYKINEDKGIVSVNTALDPWVSDDDARLEALRIAMNTIRIQPSAQQVKVTFLDPAANADSREIVFSGPAVESLWNSIQSPLAGLAVNKKAPVIDLQALKAVKGALQPEREKILAQLKEMDSKGIGVAPFVKVFLGIEQSVKKGADNKEIWENLKRLAASVEDQLKAFNSAKASKVKPAKGPETPPAQQAAMPEASGSRWVAGRSPIIEGEVLAGPAQVVSRLELEMAKGFKKVEDNPKFVLALEQIAGILYKNNRNQEAAVYQQRAAQIRANFRK